MSGPAEIPAAPPAPETLLLLVRHAEQSSLRVFDTPLSARGERQAERLARRLATLPVTAVLASTLRRARQTAAAVARATSQEVEVVADLDEIRIDDGARDRLYRRSAGSELEPHPDDYARAALSGVRMVPRTRWAGDGIEPLTALRARAVAALEEVIDRHPGGVVVCISHGVLINAVLGAWTGAERDMWFVPWHTGISAVLASGEERILLSLNDAGHLATGEEMLGLVSGAVRVS